MPLTGTGVFVEVGVSVGVMLGVNVSVGVKLGVIVADGVCVNVDVAVDDSMAICFSSVASAYTVSIAAVTEPSISGVAVGVAPILERLNVHEDKNINPARTSMVECFNLLFINEFSMCHIADKGQ